MTEQSLNTLVSVYKQRLEDGLVQTTYHRLVALVQDLKSACSKRYKRRFSVGNVLHGYLDFTYFYLQDDFLKHRKLKLALVLHHQRGCFELWLLGQTKDVQVDYWQRLQGQPWVSAQAMPMYSVFDVVLLESPDFDAPEDVQATLLTAFDELLPAVYEAISNADR